MRHKPLLMRVKVLYLCPWKNRGAWHHDIFADEIRKVNNHATGIQSHKYNNRIINNLQNKSRRDEKTII